MLTDGADPLRLRRKASRLRGALARLNRGSLAGRTKRRLGRGLHDRRTGLQLISKLALSSTKAVAGVLVHHEAHLLEVLACCGLRLLLALLASPLALVTYELPTDCPLRPTPRRPRSQRRSPRRRVLYPG